MTTAPENVGASKDRVVPGSFNIRFGTFPSTAKTEDVDAAKVASDLVATLNDAFSKDDREAIAKLFIENSYWRDHLALSWNLRTLKTPAIILEYLKSSKTPLKSVNIDCTTPFKTPTFGQIDGWGEVKGIQFFINFETNIGRGKGVVKLAEEEEGTWKIFTLYTILHELKGHEEATGRKRAKGVEHGGNPDRKNWQETRNDEVAFEGKEPKVLIIGAGQGGLAVAARLKMLDVDTLVIDTNARVGDNWRKRYRQLVLHDPVHMDHMPYIPFPEFWPVFTPKDKLAEFFEAYAKLLELNVWTETAIKSSSWNENEKKWTVTLERKKADGTTETRTFHPKHIIQATGHSGKKNFPTITGLESFTGDLLCHSSDFPGAKLNSAGRKAIVVGSCNSGHDIAQDYCEKGYDVTMVQRSTTLVVSSASIINVGMKGLYDEDGPPTEDADLWLLGFPSELFKSQQAKLTKVLSEFDQSTMDGLRKVGFGIDQGPDDAGLMLKYYQRGGGYYIDVGASQLIADGKIKVKHGQEITQVLPNGLEFADGSKLEGDEIIFATGYQNMRTEARSIFGDELADRIGDVWGLNEEGEFRTIWQKSGHPGFWFTGGNLALSRYFSRVLALQIKAIEEGLLV